MKVKITIICFYQQSKSHQHKGVVGFRFSEGLLIRSTSKASQVECLGYFPAIENYYNNLGISKFEGLPEAENKWNEIINLYDKLYGVDNWEIEDWGDLDKITDESKFDKLRKLGFPDNLLVAEKAKFDKLRKMGFPDNLLVAEKVSEIITTDSQNSTSVEEFEPFNMIKYPEINGIYRYYKGGKYQIITLAKHTETSEPMVVYKSLLFGNVDCMPLSIFTDTVQVAENDKRTRFTLIST
jgi:hypothetical protein